ncbi:MAG: hypothetical protein J4N97_06250, partial [Chloroflexi bacterium]|nr:hypothetical protein [Chloroflexota bacterium]
MVSAAVSRFASKPGDTQVIRSEKVAIFLVAASCSVAGILWAVSYGVIFGWGLTAFLPLAFTIIVGSSL